MTEIGAQAIKEFLEKFNSAKGHFQTSQREMLLALRDIMAVFADLAEKSGSEVLGLPGHLLRGIVALLDILVSQIPETGKDEELLAAKKAALGQLIAALETEAERTAAQAAKQRDLAKVEALQGLVRYLKTELDALSDDSAAARQHRQRITKIEVE